MNVSTLIVVVLGGIAISLSYGIVFGKLQPGQYLSHPFWLDIPKELVVILVVFQALAAIGFLLAIIPWIIQPPKTGVMGKHEWTLPLTLGFFFVFAVMWAPATFYKVHWLVVLSLIGTAIASIVLLAGSIEEDNPRWYIVVGLILLCIVTVLIDAVLWNAKYIRNAYKNT